MLSLGRVKCAQRGVKIKKTLKKKSPHFFAPPLRKLRGGAKKWGLLFFWDTLHHEYQYFETSSQPRNPVVDTELKDLFDYNVETRESARQIFRL